MSIGSLVASSKYIQLGITSKEAQLSVRPIRAPVSAPRRRRPPPIRAARVPELRSPVRQANTKKSG